MLDIFSEGALAALCGAAGGLALGLAARVGRFCTLGAIEDALFGGVWVRARMWGLAAAVAMALAFWLEQAGVVRLTDSAYLSTAWNPVASIVGGLMFGYGMALVGTCGFGALARLGGGDFRGLVVALVIGVTGFAAIGGVLGHARAALFAEARLPPEAAPSGAAHALGAALGLPPITLALPVALALAAWALRDAGLRRSPARLLSSLGVGAAIAGGWAATGWLARAGFTPIAVESHSFVAPIGDAILYAMTSTGGGLGLGVGSVLGVVAGAALGALWKGEFRWEACDEPRELRRQILGAALMGVGGVIALGCTIGQGLSALSVLAWSAPLVLAAIVLGAWAGLRQLIFGARAA